MEQIYSPTVIEPLFFLDEPQYHNVRPGDGNTVRGAALAVEGAAIDTVAIFCDGECVSSAAVDLPCRELAALRLPNAATCRFRCKARFEPDNEYEFRGRLTTGDWIKLFLFHMSRVELDQAKRIASAVLALPAPPAALVFTTQGGDDTQSYVDSTVSGFSTICTLLGQSGCEADGVRSVLDIGCGTGRLLLGWYADQPTRRLGGVDINSDLIAWTQQQLSHVAMWSVSNVLPPLPFESESFDLVQLASVFTHLPLEHQRRWLAEIARLMKPGGSAIVSLHGETYAKLMLDGAMQEAFAARGYVEVAGAAPGANAFSTFHSPRFAAELFAQFQTVNVFPRGNPQGQTPYLFPLASLQDVYVLRK